MPTGGTLAPPAPRVAPPPGVRQSAAAVSLGAPRVVGVHQQKSTGTPKLPKAPRTAKMPTSTKAPKGAARAPHAQPAQRTVFNPLEGSMSSGDIRTIARREAQEVLKSELEPLRGQAREVSSNELGASQRFSADTTAANNVLGGVAAQQEASAKTLENAAADNALKAGKAIETSGQQQAGQTAGYIAPELRAQLNAEAQRESAAGAADNTFAQNSAQAGQNLMAGIRGAAALRAVEGQDKMTGFFQKQGSRIQEAENARIGKVGSDQSRIENELGQKNVTDYATLQSLGLKNVAAKNQTAATKSKIGSEASKQRGERTHESQAQQKLGLEARRVGISEAKLNAEVAKDKASTAQAQAKTRVELHKLEAGGLTTSEQNKLVEQIGSAFQTIQTLRTKGVNEGKIGNTLSKGYETIEVTQGGKAKAVNVRYPKIVNPTLQHAAFELWKYHTVSAPTLAALKTLGISLTPQQLASLVGL